MRIIRCHASFQRGNAAARLAEKGINHREAENTLLPAARACGLPDTETKATIESAMRRARRAA